MMTYFYSSTLINQRLIVKVKIRLFANSVYQTQYYKFVVFFQQEIVIIFYTKFYSRVSSGKKLT